MSRSLSPERRSLSPGWSSLRPLPQGGYSAGVPQQPHALRPAAGPGLMHPPLVRTGILGAPPQPHMPPPAYTHLSPQHSHRAPLAPSTLHQGTPPGRYGSPPPAVTQPVAAAPYYPSTQPAPPAASTSPAYASPTGRAASQPQPQQRHATATGERPRVIDVPTRSHAYAMFDLDGTGKIWAFDLKTVMEACGYDMHDDQIPVLCEAFGIAKGATITKTEFHAICDYFEGVIAHNTGRADVCQSPERRRRLKEEAVQQRAGKRADIPNYTHFPGWEPGKTWKPQPDAISIHTDDLESQAPQGDMPPPPRHLPPNNDGELPVRESAFGMFDIDGTGLLSVVDLPSAITAAGFRGVRYRPHVLSLLRACGVEDTPNVSFAQFCQLCDRLTEDGLKAHSKEPK